MTLRLRRVVRCKRLDTGHLIFLVKKYISVFHVFLSCYYVLCHACFSYNLGMSDQISYENNFAMGLSNS